MSNVGPMLVPEATTGTLPMLDTSPGEPKVTPFRIPRSIQLQLARSLTFGVLGDDKGLYPSARWETENQGRYTKLPPPHTYEPNQKPKFVITSLDTRKHRPQTRKVVHLKGVGRKPVCTIATIIQAQPPEEAPRRSIYMSSFTEQDGGSRELIHKSDVEKERLKDSIVPLNGCGDGLNERPEMMLPVCDPSFMPSAKDPHRYLTRKRRVPPPFRSCGVVYPSLEHRRMTSYEPGTPRNGADLPFENEDLAKIPNINERVSVSSLSGLEFSRRRFLAQRANDILSTMPPIENKYVSVTSLAGQNFTRRKEIPHPPSQISFICRWVRHLSADVGPVTSAPKSGTQTAVSTKRNDGLLPYMKAKTII